MNLVRLGAVLLPLALFAGISHAQSVTSPALDETVPGHPDMSYSDLATLVIPDLAKAGESYEGRDTSHIRAFGETDPQRPESVAISGVRALPIKAEGKDRLVLLFDLGQPSDWAEGYAALSIFDLSGEPKLLDAVNVALDQHTSFREGGRLAIGPGDDAILTYSTHFNSSQGYMNSSIMQVHDDRIELIDTVFTFNERRCNHDFEQAPLITSKADKAHADIKVTVIETIKVNGETCDEPMPPESSRDVSAIYVWDDAKSAYAADSDALAKLAEEASQRF